MGLVLDELVSKQADGDRETRLGRIHVIDGSLP